MNSLFFITFFCNVIIGLIANPIENNRCRDAVYSYRVCNFLQSRPACNPTTMIQLQDTIRALEGKIFICLTINLNGLCIFFMILCCIKVYINVCCCCFVVLQLLIFCRISFFFYQNYIFPSKYLKVIDVSEKILDQSLKTFRF